MKELNQKKNGHGGKRRGAGRKPKHDKGIRHRTRERIILKTPAHVTIKMKKNVPGLRTKTIFKILKRAIERARMNGLYVLEYSLLHNHIHLIISAHTNKSLTRGMKSLNITFAKNINIRFKREGAVLLHRFHLHILRSARETATAMKYVLQNYMKHTGILNQADVYSSRENKSIVLDKPNSFLLIQALKLIT